MTGLIWARTIFCIDMGNIVYRNMVKIHLPHMYMIFVECYRKQLPPMGTKFELFWKFFLQFFARFSLSKLSVKFCSPYDEISFYMKEAKHSSYRTHQKLFSYHMYNWFKFEPKQNFMYFFMISSILSFNQPRLKINSLTFYKMIFHVHNVSKKLFSLKCKHFKKIAYFVGNLFVMHVFAMILFFVSFKKWNSCFLKF